VTGVEVLEVLFALADEAGFEVRVAGRGGGRDDAPPIASGICRIRETIWVVLSGEEPVDSQIEVLSRALRSHAHDWLEGRYLPPAVRARIDRKD
jgi:hypothetical protein